MTDLVVQTPWSTMRSFAQVAKEGPSGETPTTFVVADSKFPAPTGLVIRTCSTPNCKSPKISDENLCFDCMNKIGRECDNFKTCGGYHSGYGIDGKISSTLCRECYKDIHSKCQNFETCGARTKFDKDSRSYRKFCVGCHKDSLNRCVNFDRCEGRTKYDYYNSCQFEMCTDCYREFVSRCKNFDTCNGRRFYSDYLGKYNYYCHECFAKIPSSDPIVE